MRPVRIATWNVNSLKARLEKVTWWLERARPDVLLMQETKLADPEAPADAFRSAGYVLAHHGEGRWNGVAIASRFGIEGVVTNFGEPRLPAKTLDVGDDEPFAEARMISAVCGGIRVVCVSTDAPESRRSSIVCVEPKLNGCLAGELMGKFVPRGSKVAVVTGMLSTEDHRRKTDGFSEAFPRHCPGGKIVKVVEGHEDEDESFQKTFDLLGRGPGLAGIYVNTVNCLPVCRALGARGLAGKIKLITTDLFAEMSPYFQKGIITASIYQQPHRQGQIAVRLMADNLTSKLPLPTIIHLSPGVVMSSNLHLFREIRRADAKFDDSILSARILSKAAKG